MSDKTAEAKKKLAEKLANLGKEFEQKQLNRKMKAGTYSFISDKIEQDRVKTLFVNTIKPYSPELAKLVETERLNYGQNVYDDKIVYNVYFTKLKDIFQLEIRMKKILKQDVNEKTGIARIGPPVLVPIFYFTLNFNGHSKTGVIEAYVNPTTTLGAALASLDSMTNNFEGAYTVYNILKDGLKPLTK